MKGLNVSSIPGMITLVIGVAIAVSLLVVAFPLISAQFLSLSTLGNFTFASFFATSGLMYLILSAMVLIGILGIVGIKMSGGSKR